jgi:endonuclease/exonuclease/phosphatase family metal-dependent hydrolase
VVLQEFESASFLQHLANTRFPELGYISFQGHESTNWYMNVVVMSRYPLGTFYSYAPWYTAIEGQTEEDGSASVQNLVNNRMWSVEVLPHQDYQFMLTGLHLKAGRGERNEAWRLGQIKALRAQFGRFLTLNPKQNLLVVGDFNCTPESAEFQYLLAGDKALATTATTSITAPSFIDPLAGTGIFSHPADSVFWRIDHILPDRNMLPEMVGGSVKPFTIFPPEEMRAIADHLPMISRFVLSDQ